MIAGLLAVLLAAADTVPVVAPDTTATAVAAVPSTAALNTRELAMPGLLVSPVDTSVRRKAPPPVAYSEWYGRRLAVHRTLSWTMLPLFAVSYYTGDQLLTKGRQNVSSTVRTLHPIAAGGAAAIFGVNTVTGLWNLWDARKDTNGRTRRIIHSVLFLAADAGFAYAGSLGDDAGEDGRVRNRHRNIALGSMGVSTASWLIMLIGNR